MKFLKYLGLILVSIGIMFFLGLWFYRFINSPDLNPIIKIFGLCIISGILIILIYLVLDRLATKE